MQVWNATALSSELIYSGHYEKPAFDILNAPSDLYAAILENLGPYGASLPGLKVDISSLSDANVSCSLSNISGFYRIRLDRFDLNFSRFHEVGADLGQKVLSSCWKLIEERSAALKLSDHVISFNSTSRLKEGTYQSLMASFVSSPPALTQAVQTAVGFYFDPDDVSGFKSLSIIIDRAPEPDCFLLRVDITVSAQTAEFDRVAEYVRSYVTGHLSTLGLAWEV